MNGIPNVNEIMVCGRNNGDSDTNKLISILDKILPDIVNHLKDIRKILPNFDIHDEAHASKVLENMLQLSNYHKEGSEKLTNYEYFFIILSAYMHDTGMALPEWELKLFKATEGTLEFELYKDDISNIQINNDGKHPFSFSEAKEFIQSKATEIYGTFEERQEFIFAEETETSFIESLAEKLIQYQQFRNGYSFDLSHISDFKLYMERSQEIRYEFIRQHHHIYSELNCRRLSIKIGAMMGENWGTKIADDLGKISLGHGLEYSEIEDYDMKSRYGAGNHANILFITILLRLADIIHFSSDRAPASLQSSKMIQDGTSLIHWEVKQEGIEYWLTDYNEKSQREISYAAHFEDPNHYYFFQDYMDWIDMEISNYNVFLSKLKMIGNMNNDEKYYELKMYPKVNCNGVTYNQEIFQPVDNLKFTLNQTRIIELLMGVGLYKDKYLCLRELYQNALDACKCGIANGSIQEGKIEFGIKEDLDGRYVYCLDNGIGMTKRIIEEFFLKAGNSYYKSREFFERKAVWEGKVSPTSQFGIGILSCFMLGDKLEVCTKSAYNTGADFISFRVDGPHDRFYYKKTDELDKEMLGKNGTLIKIYLKDKELNNDPIENINERLFLYESIDREYYDFFIRDDIDRIKLPEEEIFDKNIYVFMNEMVLISPIDILVQVRFSNDSKVQLGNKFYVPNLTKIEELDEIIEQKKSFYDSWEGGKSLRELKQSWQNILTKNFEVSSENIKLTSAFLLPNKNFDFEKLKYLKYNLSLPSMSVFSVDGIAIDASEEIEKNPRVSNFRFSPFLIDFIGSERPELSVDRLTIPDISNDLIDELILLIDEMKKVMIEEIFLHFNEYEFEEAQITAYQESIIKKKHFFSIEFLKEMIKRELELPKALFPILTEHFESGDSILDFTKAGRCCLKRGFFVQNLTVYERIIYFNKLAMAEKIDITEEFIIIETANDIVFNEKLVKTAEFNSMRRASSFICSCES